MAKNSIQSNKGGPISIPLSPTRLTELEALKKYPDLQKGFDPRASFTHEYDLWITYGYSQSGNWGRNWGGNNRVVGGLKLTKSTPDAGTFELGVTQTYSNSEGVIHTLNATATCKHDRLALPQT